MKRNYLRLFVVFFAAAAFAAVAKGQDADRVVVNIPYEFVVSGKTLPAGTYKVGRVSDRDVRQLAISNSEERTTVFALASVVADAPGNHPSVTMLRADEQLFLTRIETGEHIFTIPVSRPAGQDATTSRVYLSGTSEANKR